MDAIQWEGNALYLLDQAKLPVIEVRLPYTGYRPVADAIRIMVMWGAPAIGVAIAYAYYLAALAGKGLDKVEEILAVSQPIAVNLFWALERTEHKAEGCGDAAESLIAEVKAIHAKDMAMYRTIGVHGAAVVPEHTHVLTHCNIRALATGGYSTALDVIRAAHETGRVNMVHCDETRPLLQEARLTAHELVSDHIPVTLITDSMAAGLMAKGRTDLAIVEYDRITANGDFANKIGTHSATVNAHYHGIPFYVVLPYSTIDLSLVGGSGTPIEEQDRDEVRTLYGIRTASESVEVHSPAFDVTPHSLVTGIITEEGVIYPPLQKSL